MRKLCVHCRREKNIAIEVLLEAGFEKQAILQSISCHHDATLVSGSEQLLVAQISPVTTSQLKLYEAVGCDYCTKGYSGRTGIFEILPVTAGIAHIIMNQGAAADIAAEAARAEMVNLRAAALRQLLGGITSLEEVQRVIL